MPCRSGSSVKIDPTMTRCLTFESAVMTFNNLFLVMAICFTLMLFLVPFLKRPVLTAPPQGAH